MNHEKEIILKKLKENGRRITKQRELLLDVILENRCSSCKEIYILASKADHTLGAATVYRMVKQLEQIGVISRQIEYKNHNG